MRITKLSVAKAAVAVATAAATFIVSPAPAAQAADNCGGWTQFPNGEGAATMAVTANLKVGPYASCGNVTSLSTGTRLYFHCDTINSYGNRWFYVRVGGTSTYGWMSYANLTNYNWWDENGDGILNDYPCA